jgi:hypothetical protein
MCHTMLPSCRRLTIFQIGSIRCEPVTSNSTPSWAAMISKAFKQSQVLRLVLNYCGAPGNSSSCSSSASSQLFACWTALNRQTCKTVYLQTEGTQVSTVHHSSSTTHTEGTQASRSLHGSSTCPGGSSPVSLLGACHHFIPTASFCSHGNSNPWGRRLLPQQLAASQQHRWKHTATQPARNSTGDGSSPTMQLQRQTPPPFTVFQLHQVLAGGRYAATPRFGGDDPAWHCSALLSWPRPALPSFPSAVCRCSVMAMLLLHIRCDASSLVVFPAASASTHIASLPHRPA